MPISPTGTPSRSRSSPADGDSRGPIAGPDRLVMRTEAPRAAVVSRLRPGPLEVTAALEVDRHPRERPRPPERSTRHAPDHRHNGAFRASGGEGRAAAEGPARSPVGSRMSRAAVGVCVDRWLPHPVLVILVSMLDQRHGGYLLVLDQIRRPDLNGLGLAPRGKDHPFMLEHLLIEVERCAQQ
jgi:hypothetical protein